MPTTRREFLTASALAAAALAAGGVPGAMAAGRPAGARRPDGKPLRILILGGTGFLGPAIVEDALAKHYDLTLFNRGKREKVKGTDFEGVEKLLGNRDPQKHSEEKDPDSPLGLSQIEALVKDGKKWDAVIDTSGYFPRHVKASAELLAKAADQYMFISTVSVYAANDTPGADETAAVGTIPDPTVENMGANLGNYGPLKALCEQAAEAAMPGRVTNIRPGFIVGVRDDTDRFTYWPVRASQGGEMLVPGAAGDPIQIIDVRDLARFILRCIEDKHFGVMNATGPVGGGTWGQVIDACKAAAKPGEHDERLTLTWVPNDFLVKNNVEIGGDLPIYIPPDGEAAGFHQRSIAKATAAGLTTRPVVETCREILAWWPKELERRAKVTKDMQAAAKPGTTPPAMPDPTKLRAGMSPEREAEILEAWKKEKAAK
ncbi:MAG: NAD-dependent epimerase/dehydratase family protein [Tepidisphaera sp.]|nr:NAD-dependent epimerase/dehydratase family protein [Tepidisphaera sp.]